jgi:hypothetical protein
MIYSQAFLMGQGLAVTWDNPDIHLEKGGAPVSSGALEVDTEYEIVARVWNGSPMAPAVNLPVRFSYVDFGIGGITTAIGETRIDLPVKGATGLPVGARQKWRTPPTPGHYCLRVELVWADDANPANNIGQENLTVKQLNSPRATFVFPVRNEARTRRGYRFDADTYELPEPRPCGEVSAGRAPRLIQNEVDQRKAAAMAHNGRGRFAVPNDWDVVIDPVEIVLGPGEEMPMTVDITAPDNFEGQQAINVAAWVGAQGVGGVTLMVHS